MVCLEIPTRSIYYLYLVLFVSYDYFCVARICKRKIILFSFIRVACLLKIFIAGEMQISDSVYTRVTAGEISNG